MLLNTDSPLRLKRLNGLLYAIFYRKYVFNPFRRWPIVKLIFGSDNNYVNLYITGAPVLMAHFANNKFKICA